MEINSKLLHEVKFKLSLLKKMCHTLKDIDKFSEIEEIQNLLDEAIDKGDKNDTKIT